MDGIKAFPKVIPVLFLPILDNSVLQPKLCVFWRSKVDYDTDNLLLPIKLISQMRREFELLTLLACSSKTKIIHSAALTIVTTTTTTLLYLLLLLLQLILQLNRYYRL